MSGERPAPAFRLLIAPINAALDALWRLCVEPSAAAGLALLAAFAIAAGLALPQAPWEAAGDPASFGRWLADLQMRHGAWVAWPARAGFLSLHTAPGFRLLWAAIGFAALISGAESLLAWRERAGCFPWRVLAHAGLLLLLAGARVDERWGWEQEQLLVGSGRAVAVGPPAAGLAIERIGSQAAGPEGMALSWRWGVSEGRAEIAAGKPLFFGGTTLHLQQTGPAARLRLVDATGQAVPLDDPTAGGHLQPEVTLRFRREGESRYVSVPSRDWVIRVAHQPAAAEPPFTLWVYRGLEATALAQAAPGAGSELAVGGYRLRWELVPYVEIRAALHPGLALWAAGWPLLCAGLLLCLVGMARGQAGAPGPANAAYLVRAWLPATLALGGVAWVGGGGLRMPGGALSSAGLLFLALAAALLLLAAASGVLAGLGHAVPAFCAWPAAAGWGLLAWLVGGGLGVAAAWLAEGTLWRWQASRAWWALSACLLAAAWHLQSSPRRRLQLALLAAAAVLAAGVVVGGMRNGFTLIST